MSNTTSLKLPNGEWLLTRVAYTSKEDSGVTFLLVVSALSLVAVIGLLSVISLSAFNTRSYKNEEHLFVRTHVAAYFISLLLCDLIQSIGSLYNSRWVNSGAVLLDKYCTAQGVFKQIADVGTALWTIVIAVHTFYLLVLERKPNQFTMFASLIAGWSGIFAIVISGPAVLDTVDRGPFFGISGYWCWISDGYEVPRITLDYLFMFVAAFSCFVLHGLIHLRLRGNMSMKGWRMSFYKQAQERPTGRHFDDKGMSIARQMLLFPIAYCIIILPIAVSRFAAWNGHIVSFEETVFCETVFLLSGCVNVTLFCTCRQILPPQSMVLLKRSISKPKPIERAEPSDANSPESDPYYASSISTNVVGYGFDKSSQDGHDVDLEKGTNSNRMSVASNEGSSGVSVPYEQTVAPLQIRKSVRHPRPPSVIIPSRELNDVYDMYSGGHPEVRSTEFNDVNLDSSGHSGPHPSYR
ncbi:hypothetical protein J3R30DRAFT_3731812 [Lentinula aciculospora]|uniref:Glucose receptor Git3 N-terminal domain-containing protein n=1 Tax=Lentinula aciculospora TaxID=153920 RepID=A0A9W9DS75_9AGAR|nr:hypothetical protein J3R30DRAFT_3731812 [Lentinula aciculospora]